MGPNALAIFREFPFLASHYAWRPIKEVRVARLDEKLLKLEAAIAVGGTAETYAWLYHHDVLFLDGDGQVLARLGEVQREINFLGLKFRRVHFDRFETVADVLDSIQNQERVCYLTQLEDGTLTLYKPPKGFTVAGWYEKLIADKHAELKKASDAIDAEGSR